MIDGPDYSLLLTPHSQGPSGTKDGQLSGSGNGPDYSPLPTPYSPKNGQRSGSDNRSKPL